MRYFAASKSILPHAAVAALLSCATLVQAQLPLPPLEPAPAPNPGLTVETFDRIQLSPRPGEGESVPGWFPILREQYNGMSWDLVESAPDVFEATGGVLRFYDSGERSGQLGRVRQLPAGTNELCVDVYIPDYAPAFVSFGLIANTLGNADYGLYGMTISKQMYFDSSEEGAEEGPFEEFRWVVMGSGFYEVLDGDFGDQWVRLCLRIDEAANQMIASVNGVVVFEGYPKIRLPRINGEPEVFPPLPLFTDGGLIGGFNDISSPEGGAEESFTEVFAFFDNFSFGPSQGAFDVTVGPGAGARGRVGEDVFSAAMKRQKVSLSGTANETLSAYFGIENESGVTTEASLRSRVSNARSIGYRAFLENGSGRSNITSSLRSGRFSTDIGSGDTAVVVSEASLKGRIRQIVARSRGAVKRGSFGLVAQSASNPSAIDSASAILEFNSLIPINRRGRY